MTPLQRIELKRSELRTKLADLTGQTDQTDETRAEIAELTAAYQATETEYRGALAADDTPPETTGLPPEQRQRIELRDKCSLSKYLTALAKGAKLDGAEAEFASETGCEAREFPMEIFEREREAEQREAAEQRVVTGAPGTVGVNLTRIYPYVFAPSIAPYFGVAMPQVASGTYGVPQLSTALTAAAQAKGSDSAATAAQFNVVTATPKRVSARLEFLIEDIAAAGTNLEAALRENLRMALSAELDNQLINGDGTAPNLTGLFARLTNPTADGTTLSFDHGIGKLADLIDGLWATETAHVRQMVGVDTYRLAAKSVSVPATGGKGEMTLADYLRQHSGGLRTNSRMPAAASTKQQGLAFRAGMPGAMAIAPSWGRIAIDDPYSESAKGQRSVTVHALVGDVILVHPAAYAQTEFKVS